MCKLISLFCLLNASILLLRERLPPYINRCHHKISSTLMRGALHKIGNTYHCLSPFRATSLWNTKVKAKLKEEIALADKENRYVKFDIESKVPGTDCDVY